MVFSLEHINNRNEALAQSAQETLNAIQRELDGIEDKVSSSDKYLRRNIQDINTNDPDSPLYDPQNY